MRISKYSVTWRDTHSGMTGGFTAHGVSAAKVREAVDLRWLDKGITCRQIITIRKI